MQDLTLTIGLVASSLIMIFRPVFGLGIYFAVLFLYPSYLTIQVFGCNFSAQRIAIAALTVRALMEQGLVRKFKFNLPDKLVGGMFVIGFVTMLMTMETGEFAKTYCGQFMDSILVYFVVRLIITDKRAFFTVIKTLSVLLLVIAALGVIQSVTGRSPYDGMYVYCPWNQSGQTIWGYQRLGFYRAFGPFGVHIMFGLSFVAFGPLILLLKQAGGFWKESAYVFFGAAVAGALSSFSAGPYLGLVIIFICLLLKQRPGYVKPLLTSMVVMVIAGQLISNRGFFYVVGRFTFSEGTAWYRARLVDVAISKLPEYWLFGYGMADPGWGELIDTRDHTDICNQYVLQAVYHGVGGLAIFAAVLWASVAGLCHFRRFSAEARDKEIAWLIGTAIAALAVVFLSVGVFGKFTSILFALLGIAGCFYLPRVKTRVVYCQPVVSGIRR